MKEFGKLQLDLTTFTLSFFVLDRERMYIFLINVCKIFIKFKIFNISVISSYFLNLISLFMNKKISIN